MSSKLGKFLARLKSFGWQKFFLVVSKVEITVDSILKYWKVKLDLELCKHSAMVMRVI